MFIAKGIVSSEKDKRDGFNFEFVFYRGSTPYGVCIFMFFESIYSVSASNNRTKCLTVFMLSNNAIGIINSIKCFKISIPVTFYFYIQVQ